MPTIGNPTGPGAIFEAMNRATRSGTKRHDETSDLRFETLGDRCETVSAGENRPFNPLVLGSSPRRPTS